MRCVWCATLFYRRGNWGLERFRNLPTQQQSEFELQLSNFRALHYIMLSEKKHSKTYSVLKIREYQRTPSINWNDTHRWEKIFANHINSKGLVPTYKELSPKITEIVSGELGSWVLDPKLLAVILYSSMRMNVAWKEICGKTFPYQKYRFVLVF